MGGCQNLWSLLGPYYNTAPLGFNFDNYPYAIIINEAQEHILTMKAPADLLRGSWALVSTVLSTLEKGF